MLADGLEIEMWRRARVEAHEIDGAAGLEDSLCYFRHICDISQGIIWTSDLYMLWSLYLLWNESFVEGRVFKWYIFLSGRFLIISGVFHT